MVWRRRKEIKISLQSWQKSCLLEIKGKEIKDQGKIMENLYQFCENAFSNNVPVSKKSITNFFAEYLFTKTFLEAK